MCLMSLQAAESVYNMLKHRKMIRPVPFGEVSEYLLPCTSGLCQVGLILLLLLQVLLFMIASALTMRSIK